MKLPLTFYAVLALLMLKACRPTKVWSEINDIITSVMDDENDEKNRVKRDSPQKGNNSTSEKASAKNNTKVNPKRQLLPTVELPMEAAIESSPVAGVGETNWEPSIQPSGYDRDMADISADEHGQAERGYTDQLRAPTLDGGNLYDDYHAAPGENIRPQSDDYDNGLPTSITASGPHEGYSHDRPSGPESDGQTLKFDGLGQGPEDDYDTYATNGPPESHDGALVQYGIPSELPQDEYLVDKLSPREDDSEWLISKQNDLDPVPQNDFIVPGAVEKAGEGDLTIQKFDDSNQGYQDDSIAPSTAQRVGEADWTIPKNKNLNQYPQEEYISPNTAPKVGEADWTIPKNKNLNQYPQEEYVSPNTAPKVGEADWTIPNNKNSNRQAQEDYLVPKTAQRLGSEWPAQKYAQNNPNTRPNYAPYNKEPKDGSGWSPSKYNSMKQPNKPSYSPNKGNLRQGEKRPAPGYKYWKQTPESAYQQNSNTGHHTPGQYRGGQFRQYPGRNNQGPNKKYYPPTRKPEQRPYGFKGQRGPGARGYFNPLSLAPGGRQNHLNGMSPNAFPSDPHSTSPQFGPKMLMNGTLFSSENGTNLQHEGLVEISVVCDTCENDCPDYCSSADPSTMSTRIKCCANSVLFTPNLKPSCPVIDTSQCNSDASEYYKYNEMYYLIEVALRQQWNQNLGDVSSVEFQNLRSEIQSFVLRVYAAHLYFQDTNVGTIRSSKETAIVTILVRFRKENKGNLVPLYKALRCDCADSLVDTKNFIKISPANTTDLVGFCPNQCFVSKDCSSMNECLHVCCDSKAPTGTFLMQKLSESSMIPPMTFGNGLFDSSQPFALPMGQICPNNCPAICAPGCSEDCCTQLPVLYRRGIKQEPRARDKPSSHNR